VEVLADLAKPWATRAPLSAIPTACLKGHLIRAATAPPPDSEEKTMTTHQPDWQAYLAQMETVLA
jgi:hypothetical protein